MALTRTVSDFKDSVKAASTGANINLAAAPNTLDGITLVANDRVLVKDQTPSSLNGIYRVTTLGTGANGSWTRASDFNDYRQISSGAMTFVEQGSINGNVFYYIPGGEPNVQIGTTAITFSNLYSFIDTTNTLQSVTNYGNSTTNIITISNTATSTSTTSGALIVSGGAGISGNLYVGGNLSIAGNTTFINTTTITTTDTIAAPAINANVIGNTGSSHYGTIATNAQPFITSVGTLTSLTVTGAVQANTHTGVAVYAGTIGNTGTTLTGTLSTPSQTNITSVGTLGSLTVTGAVNANTFNGVAVYAGTIGNTGATLTGTLSTASQTNITSVGTLGSLTVTGAVNANTFNGVAVYAGTIGNSGSTLTGTLSTATQTNITSTGALTSPSFTTSSGGQLTGYHTGAIGANAANSGAFTTLTASGNTTLNNYANIYIATGSTASTSALSIVGNIYGQGGTGYLDFLKLTNTYSAGTNPNKYFRLNPTGGLEVVNSAYTQVIFILSDTGSITIPTTATATVGNLVTTSGVYWSNGAAYSSGGGGSGTPGGANTMVQFNNGGSFAGATYLQYNITSGNLVSSSTTASTNNTTGAIVVSGGIGVGGNVTADIVHATNNGNGTNFQIGDDLWLGDINVANTARVMGQQDNTQGYIVFGSTNSSNYIGRSGSNPITVTGAFNVTGTTNLQGTTNGTTINATTIQGGTIGNSGATFTGATFTAATSIVPGSNNAVNLGGSSSQYYSNIWANIHYVGSSVLPGANIQANIGGVGSNYFNYIYGVNFVGTSTTAKYADLAEMYHSDSYYSPGTVMILGGDYDVTVSTQSHDTTVAGVVSTNPAYLMNDNFEHDNWLPIALTGRVPCLVRGPVNKGTLLVSSSERGVACALDKSLYEPGCIIGKSMDIILDDSIVKIEIAVGRF